MATISVMATSQENMGSRLMARALALLLLLLAAVAAAPAPARCAPENRTGEKSAANADLLLSPTPQPLELQGENVLPRQYDASGDSFAPATTPSARFTHNHYVQRVRPGARERTFYPGGRNSGGLGSRRYDDFDPRTGTAFEGNTIPWSQMTPEQLQRKLEQVASDLMLLRDRQSGVRRVIWFGTEELPTTGLGGQLRQALQQSGIPYWVVNP